jgi:glycosyltransferase involved in cell wall biosynthesis
MGRLLGLTVGYNEEHRYLDQMLNHYMGIFDDHFFFDDRSTDNTADVAQGFLCKVVTRSEYQPSFAENEGYFRQTAWDEFEWKMNPEDGDWVLVVDCDEFLVSKSKESAYTEVRRVITSCNDMAVDLPIPEVFGLDNNDNPLVRIDRLWGTIHAPRLFKYQPNGSYFPGKLGVPAVPSYVMNGSWSGTEALALMHYGYANPEDHLLKYNRYNEIYGHSRLHIDSIIAKEKDMVRWDYAHPEVRVKIWENQLES